MSTKVKQRLNERMLRTLRALARSRGEDPRQVQLPHFVNHDVRRTVRSQLAAAWGLPKAAGLTNG